MKREGTLKSLIVVLALILLMVSTVACSAVAKAPSAIASLPVPADKVVVQNSSFDPSITVVTVGNAVKWTNLDQISYSISEDNQSFAFDLPAGDSFSINFTEVGVFNYHCTDHPRIQGTITVSNGDTCKAPAVTDSAVAELVTKVRPSVVAVNTELTVNDIFGRPVSQQLAGTGWILDSKGLIVTNNHVVEGAGVVTVTLDNGQTYPAMTVRTDPVNDLAVIDIGVSPLPAVKMGDSSSMEVGDQVIALGNALGQGIRATQGVISNTDSTMTVDSRETLYNVLQTTAPIDFGNSGGPLVNMNGEVIGITSAAKITRTGTELAGYAISSNIAGPIIQQLAFNGCVTRAWLGVTTSSVGQFQSLGYKLSLDQGALVTKVAANSPAEKGGLRPGDIIVGLDDKSITSTDDLVKGVRSNLVGQAVEINYWRDNQPNTTVITLLEKLSS